MKEKELLDDFGLGLFSYFEPEKHSGDELLAMLNSAKQFQDFKKDVPELLKDIFQVGLRKSWVCRNRC